MLGLEQERIHVEEEAERARARAEAESKKREVEASRREEEALRISAIERRRAEEQANREEAARLEAIRVAAIQKARHQAESDARLRLLAQQQEHEQRLATLTHDRAKKRLRAIVFVTAGLCVGSFVLGYALVQRSEQKAQMERSALWREAEVLRDQKEQEIDRLKADRDRLGQKDQRERQELEERLRILREQLDAADQTNRQGKGGSQRPIPPAQVPAPSETPPCEKGDPMCETLGR